MDATEARATVGGIIAMAAGATIALTAWSEPLAAQTSTAVVPFSEFVSDLTFAPAADHVGRSDVAPKRTAAFEEMRQHLLKLYSGIAVARSFQRDDKVFDCLPIIDQPGVRLRKLKTVATPPPSPPAGVSGEGHERDSSIGDLQNSADGPDAPGNTQRCEDDTIPMRRQTPEELARFESLKSYFAKGPQDAGRVHRNGRSIPPAFTVTPMLLRPRMSPTTAGIRYLLSIGRMSTPAAARFFPFPSNGMLAEAALKRRLSRWDGRITRQNMGPKTLSCSSTGQRITTAVRGATTSIAQPSCKPTAIGVWGAVSRTTAPSVDHSMR